MLETVDPLGQRHEEARNSQPTVLPRWREGRELASENGEAGSVWLFRDDDMCGLCSHRELSSRRITARPR